MGGYVVESGSKKHTQKRSSCAAKCHEGGEAVSVWAYCFFFFFFFSLGFGSLLFPRGKATKESAKETKIDSNTTKHKQSHTRGRMRWKVAVFEVVGGFLLANTRWFAQRGLNSFKARAAVEGHALGFRRIPAYSSAVAMFKRSRVALSQHFSLPS